jgi:hypothetical protein
MGMTKKEKERLQEILVNSPSYRIAYKDLDFLDSGIARSVRLQTEWEKPEYVFRRNKIYSTIVVFGGTRIVEASEADRKIKEIERKLARKPGDTDLKRQLKIARRIRAKSPYYDEARKFATLASAEGQNHDGREFVVVTGGGPGIMEAANRGAYDINAKSIGLNITLPMEQEPNAYISPELCLQFHYFAIRKMHFMKRAKALVAFPGGFGTLDELFEGLTLVQTMKIRTLPIILFGEEYWRGVLNLQYLVDEGTIAEDDLKLFVYCDKAEDAWNYIKYYYAERGEAL